MVAVLPKLSNVQLRDKYIADSVPKSIDLYPLQETSRLTADSTRISSYDSYIGSKIIRLTALIALTVAYHPNMSLANLLYRLSL